MAKVLFAFGRVRKRGTDYSRGAFRKLRESAMIDTFRFHALTNNPISADVILFAAGPYFEAVRKHPLVKRFREKCFLFCSNDFVIPFLTGIYASIEKRWSSVRTVSGFYLGVSENKFVTLTPPADDFPYIQYLRSFHFRHFLRTRVQAWRQSAGTKP